MNNGTNGAVVTDPRSLTLHEVCSAWPPMTDAELESLSQDILENNRLVHPILLYQGRIIDGRNRWIAGLNVGYEFKPTDFAEHEDQCTIVRTVKSLNNERRELTLDQKRAVAAGLQEPIAIEKAEEKRRKCSDAGKQGGRGNKRVAPTIGATLSDPPKKANSTREAAKLMGVGEAGVRAASRIKEASPEAFEKVKRGETTIAQASKDLGLSPGKHQVPIAPGSKATKTVVVPENTTRLEDLVEDHEEREAIKSQDSDAVWVEGLPLYGQLQGKLRDDFVYAAIACRQVQAARREWAKAVGSVLKSNKKTPPWFYAHVRALEQLPPDGWHLCPPCEDGGCGGEGVDVAALEAFGGKPKTCQRCFGSGYLTRG